MQRIDVINLKTREARVFTHLGIVFAAGAPFDLVASGPGNSKIAVALCISPKTVRNHINHIFSKLDVQDRAHAIVLAREAGLGLRKEGRSA